MKKVTVVFLIIILFISIFFVSCKQDPNQTTESKKFLSDLKQLESKFIDKTSLAKTTSGIALSPMISDMQDISREVSNLEIPKNADQLSTLRELSINGMNQIIDGFQMSQSQGNENEIHKKINDGLGALKVVAIKISELENSPTKK